MNKPRQTNDNFTGLFIPRLVLEDARLNAPARILFGCLDGLGRTERGCYAGSGYLASIVGIKPRQLRNLLNLLEATGYITRINLPRGGRIIKTVTAQALQKVRGWAAMDCHGGRQYIATDIILDKENPLTPLKGGRVKRFRNKVALKAKDYSNGF